jgi:hypothetical protein
MSYICQITWDNFEDLANIHKWDESDYKAEHISPDSWRYRYRLKHFPGKKGSKKVRMEITVSQKSYS